MKTTIFTFAFSLLFFSGFAQSKLSLTPAESRTITLEFDNSGKLINSIPSAIRKNDILRFNIPPPDSGSVFKKYNMKQKQKVFQNDTCVTVNAQIKDKKSWEKYFSYYLKLEILKNDGTRINQSVPNLNDTTFKYVITNEDVSIEYKIIKTNEDNIFLANYLKEKIGKYHTLSKYRNYLQKLEKTFNSYALKVDGLLLKDTLDSVEACIGCKKKVIKTNFEVLDSLQKNDKNLCDINRLYTTVIKENKDWIEQWLWYTEGKINLNPFDIYDPSEEILENDRQINLLTEKLILRKELSKKASPPAGIKELGEIESKISDITDTLNIRLKLKQALIEQKDSYYEWLKSISQKSEILYKGILFSSDNERIAWMHHYDAKRNFQQQNLASTLPRWISEQDEVFVLTHNIDTAKISLKPNIIPIPIKSKLEEQIMPIDEVLTKSLANKDVINKINLFNKTFGMKESLFDNANSKLNKESDIKVKIPTEDEYKSQVINFKVAKQNLKWLLEQTEPPSEIKLKDGKNPKYYTDLQIIDEPVLDNSNLKVDYSLFVKGKEKEVSSSGYKKYKLVSFWPAVGIAHVTQPRNVAEFANGTFTNNTEIGQFEATVGVKWYPWKTNVAYDRSTRKAIEQLDNSYNTDRGNNRLLNRLSLYVGLGVSQKVLKSYFAGVSWDITPGLSIQGGTNIYFNKYYDLSNGVVENVYEKPTFNPHFSITIDPGVVPFLLKFL
jgi:hypothetical protein